MRKPYFWFVASASLCFSLTGISSAWASACCGGGHASPGLVAGDELRQLTASFTQSYITEDIYPDGIWSQRDSRERSETFRLSAAQIFFDRWQAGVSIPVVRRSRKGRNETGVGDISGQIGYEFLPDWSYHPIRPKGIAYLQLTAPSGRAAQAANAPFLLDSTGRGFWTVGAGTLFTKARDPFDLFLKLDLRRAFPRNFQVGGSSVRFVPGWGGELSLGAGLNYDIWRIGGALSWVYEEAIEATGRSKGAAERYGTATLSAGAILGESWAVSANYSNQKWIGSPVNTTLGQAVSLQVQRRWPR